MRISPKKTHRIRSRKIPRCTELVPDEHQLEKAAFGRGHRLKEDKTANSASGSVHPCANDAPVHVAAGRHPFPGLILSVLNKPHFPSITFSNTLYCTPLTHQNTKIILETFLTTIIFYRCLVRMLLETWTDLGKFHFICNMEIFTGLII